jgi:hypothetical protein
MHVQTEMVCSPARGVEDCGERERQDSSDFVWRSDELFEGE